MAYEHPELQNAAKHLSKAEYGQGLELAPDTLKASVAQPWSRTPPKYPLGTPFTYEPLLQDHIRLLRVSKDEIAQEGICCDFVVTPLDATTLPYVAISYCWGQPGPGHVMLHTDGRHVRTTDSAFVLIKTLTQIYGDLVLWIDALCINQDDLDEKNRQVPMMARIYRRASKVLVWLGEESDDSTLATKCLTRIVSTWMNRTKAPSEDANSLPTNYMTPEEAAAVAKLLNRPWFSRTWIIQEVTTADSVFVHVGSWAASWSVLPTFRAIILTDAQLNDLSKFWIKATNDISRAPVGLETLRVLAHIRREMVEDSSGRRFSRWDPVGLIMQTLSFKATKPVDRVYGFMGLFPPFAPTAQVTVEYRLMPEEVFGQFSLTQLQHGGVAHILLGQAGILRAFSKGWPSWIPNLAPQRPYSVLSIMSHYRASGSSSFQGVVANRCKSIKDGITLRMMLLDSIVGLPNIPKEQMGTRDSSKACFLWLFETMPDLLAEGRYLPTGEYLLEPLWRTMCVNFDTNGPAEKHLEGSFFAWLRNLGIPLGELIESDTDAWYKYRDALSQAGFGTLRVPFSTQRGYVGIADHGIQVGDRICIVEGGWVPYIVRDVPTDKQSDMRYNLVCESYVHGLMNGEGLEQGTWQELEIC